MYPPVPRGELAIQGWSTSNVCFTAYATQSDHIKQLTDNDRELHSEHSKFYIYLTDTQWECTAARTTVTRSTKKDPNAGASI